MKKIFAFILALSILFSLSACSELGALKDLVSNISDIAEDWEKYSEARAKLIDYKLTIESVNSDGDKEIVTEMRCEDGYALIQKDSIIYVEYGTGKYYMLSETDKTGTMLTLSSDESYKSFSLAITGYILLFETYRIMGAKEDGSEKITGRQTTRYKLDKDDNEYKFWVDKEYGMTMKYTTTEKDSLSSMEVTEFKIGGIKLSDMVNINDYKIEDFASNLNSDSNSNSDE